MGGGGAGLRRAGCGLRVVVQLTVHAGEPGELRQPSRPRQHRPGRVITVGGPDQDGDRGLRAQ